MPTDKIQTDIRLPEPLLSKIKFIARYNRRSLNGQLDFLAERCVEAFEREHGEITAP